MKKFTVAFMLLMLCYLLLANMVFAAEEGYVIDEAYSAGGVELDGEWGEAEWDSSLCWIEWIDPYDARFGYKMATMAPYFMGFIIEFPDSTNDAEDVWQICIDGDASDGTAPDEQDNKIEIVGHETVTVYVGDGQGWVEMQGADLQWNESLTTTAGRPAFESDHYVVEILVDKGTLGAWGANPPPHGLRVAMYDASNEAQGWIAWPPTDPDIPDTWGRIDQYGATVPESLSLGVVALLSSVAVAIAIYSVRNRKKFPK